MSDISLEPLLNGRMVKGPAGPTTQRQVSLTADTPAEITPTSGCTAMHIFNNTAETIHYGGSTVSASSPTGVKLFNQGTLVINAPKSNFSIYFVQTGGGAVNLDIVEFF
jgi:hypothetical protein